MKIALSLFLLNFSLSLQAQRDLKGFKVATYNLALAHHYIAFAQERRPHLIKAIASVNADLLCLQEVWQASDRQRIKEELKSIYPYQHLTPIQQTLTEKRPACGWRDLFGKGKFITCMRQHCSQQEGEKSTHCLLNTCGPALKKLRRENQKCSLALMAQVGKSSLRALFTVLNPFQRAGLFSYEGSNGLLLLSKYPLLKKSLLDLSPLSTLTRRGAIAAEVEIPNKKIHVFCTHLSANLRKVPYSGNFQNWSQENKAQLKLLLQEAQKKALPTLIMGDFNFGPQKKDLHPVLPDSYRLTENSSFHNVLLKKNPSCTFCSHNTFNQNSQGKGKNNLIDHIYVKNLQTVEAKVILKKKVLIETKEKKKVSTHLSDHFGVWAHLK